ncbi:hypothetical protein RHGRI_032633 [Rhododendron griersonianum]|uniref:EF-hand domain-containing protein n=1 Tax=Rhododendron griersonianum TaxID=479676 RepID=A0AAV6ID41_9ERIC|nr:hypothetical protein RHGRI_032633 [Rhododendron griersonianum]
MDADGSLTIVKLACCHSLLARNKTRQSHHGCRRKSHRIHALLASMDVDANDTVEFNKFIREVDVRSDGRRMVALINLSVIN